MKERSQAWLEDMQTMHVLFFFFTMIATSLQANIYLYTFQIPQIVLWRCMQVIKTRNLLGVKLTELYNHLSNPVAALTSKGSDEYQRALNILKTTIFPCNMIFLRAWVVAKAAWHLARKWNLMHCAAYFTKFTKLYCWSTSHTLMAV